MYLYEQIQSLRDYGAEMDLPHDISENLNPKFKIRRYQNDAFCNFLTYFENDRMRRNPSQSLFHMATGSGKTLIMAGLIIYLYKKGYRNFLFFVNLDNIIQKTKDNFLNNHSSKYLFSEKIEIEGEEVFVKEVSNFQAVSDNSINICFSTIQGLHSSLTNFRECSITLDDFEENEIVFISDEAHHINADTKKSIKQDKCVVSWEAIVQRMFRRNPKNVLLEFTATCDLNNPLIKEEYEDKIIFDYPLKKFREDGFSKEVKTLQSHIPLLDRMLQATLLSQYRMKLFQEYRWNIKPIILFKSQTINDSRKNIEEYHKMISSLDYKKIESLRAGANSSILNAMYSYFEKKEITFEQLVQEIKEDFGDEHCVSVNDDSDAKNLQIVINSLEDEGNPYRAIFEVKKLDEGWDVLNLFDIVRLYETRDSKAGKPGSYTIGEAQLIGRGARYCPFAIDREQDMQKRKYDADVNNPLRVCEELYYHCQYDSKYIAELHKALIETGIMPKRAIERDYALKDDFKKSELYNSGYVFANSRVLNDRKNILGIPQSVRDKEYSFSVYSGQSSVHAILDKELKLELSEVSKISVTFRQISEINFNIVHSAMRKYDCYKFNNLKLHFPNLRSIREFIESSDYLGDIKILMMGSNSNFALENYYDACFYTLGKIKHILIEEKETYIGTSTFEGRPFKSVFKEKRVNYPDSDSYGLGVSQADPIVPEEMRMELSKKDWFACYDNYGTSEEKSFVAYFSQHIKAFQSKYDKIYLVRNERHLPIFSFENGERFEPDYLLFLQKNGLDESYEQLQIFIEPKGDHLLASDSWKEKFLLELETKGIPITKLVDDNRYFIWGFPFYNRNHRLKEFTEAINRL